MSPFERWTVHLSNLLVGGTGLVYAFMLYALEPIDEFSVLHHPLQGTVQHLHVLVAPLLVFAAGLIFREHIWFGFRQGGPSGRRSGLTLLGTLVPMIASGYLLQTATDDTWRRVWVAVHVGASAAWLLGYLAHWVAKVKRGVERPTRWS
ncbi:MAG: hypothetical protein SF066_00405 [Thermoanaerobaculia bacterium]|nr:hypothetical protein [Thermoanaerobaculia bacterium]